MNNDRRGFTLIEVMIALVILTIVSVSLGKFVGSFLHAVGTSTTKTVATAVAQEQLEIIRADPNYANLVATYNGQTATGFPGYAAMTRTLRVVRTTGNAPRRDYTTITVTVSEPTMGTPINVTIVVAAP
jgi:prepilin-type N-terminal cleavage/methylation domain-containing protein